MAPPFLDIDGLGNARDCGGYPVEGRPGMAVRRGILFRSADPSALTATGVAQLQALAIARVFDLRCDSEIRDSAVRSVGAVRAWHPAQRTSLPVFTDAQYAQRPPRQGLVDCGDILASAVSPDNDAQPVKTLVAHLATSTSSAGAGAPRAPAPVLVHGSLGKDRTGVMCAVVLSLCGVSDAAVAREYALSAAGPEAGTADGEPFSGSRDEAMLGFLERMRRDYGSIEQYLTDLGVTTAAEVQQLRDNMVVPSEDV